MDEEYRHHVTLQILALDRSTRIPHMSDVTVFGDLADWCMDNVGRDNFSFGWEYPGDNSNKYYRIRFKNGEDAAACTLRWGGILV